MAEQPQVSTPAPGLSPRARRWLAGGLVLFLAAFILQGQLLRPLWYDEALTLLEFVGQGSAAFVYQHYPIPNNHIVYNLLLMAWAEVTPWILPLGDVSFRFFGYVLSLASVLAMMVCWRRRTGWQAATLAAACLALSPAFLVYGVAVRGYQLGFLAVLLALESGRRWRDGGPRWQGVAYFAASLAAVGTMPTNLLALATIPLLPDRPLAVDNFFRPRRLWLGFAPVLAFLAFYLPIARQLLKVMGLREGWPDFGGAAIHLYAAFGLMAVPLLVGLVPGLAICWRRGPRSATIAGLVIFLLPAVAMLARNPVPFPRAFYPFWPVWLFLLALTFRAGEAGLRRHFGREWARGLAWQCLPITIFMGTVMLLCADGLSARLTPAGAQDDFFRPYFMRPDFRPRETVELALELSGKVPGMVFFHPGADPQSLLYWGKIRRGGLVPENHWGHDRPDRKWTFTTPPTQLFLVVRDEAQARELAMRFQLDAPRRAADCGYHQIYVATK